MTDRDIVSAFEQGETAGEFSHAMHVRVAWAYLADFGLGAAIDRFSDALLRFATARGATGHLHRTMTVAYLLIIEERRQLQAGATWEQFASANPDVLTHQPSVLDHYYTAATLESAQAKQAFVMPDRIIGSAPPAQPSVRRARRIDRSRSIASFPIPGRAR